MVFVFLLRVAHHLLGFVLPFVVIPQDELDAAERVVKSNAEIRQVLLDHDKTSRAGEFVQC